MIYRIEPKLIKVDGSRVIGYKHLIPIESPITTTNAIVYGNGIILPIDWVVFSVVEFVLFEVLFCCI